MEKKDIDIENIINLKVEKIGILEQREGLS